MINLNPLIKAIENEKFGEISKISLANGWEVMDLETQVFLEVTYSNQEVREITFWSAKRIVHFIERTGPRRMSDEDILINEISVEQILNALRTLKLDQI